MNIDRLIENGYIDAEHRPEDGQHVAFLFKPFMTFHAGIYEKEADTVMGGSGYTDWPYVVVWYPLPGIE